MAPQFNWKNGGLRNHRRRFDSFGGHHKCFNDIYIETNIMKDFIKWFKSEGYKEYLTPILIAIVLDILLITTGDGLWTDGGTGASAWHLIMVSIAHLLLLGFNIGIIKAMIDKYKIDTKK